MSRHQYPHKKDADEFESLVKDLCEKEYGIKFQIYGRNGQAQKGIDGLSFSNNKKKIVFQCKNKFNNRDDKKITAELLTDIEKEVKSANTKYTNIDTFIFATSFNRDTGLQDKATEFNNDENYNFNVIVWSWDDIEGLLEKNHDIAKAYYPWFFDNNILSDNEIKNTLQQNSVTLLSSTKLYIEKSFIDVPEIDQINDFINNENFDDSLLVLTGKAGIGKTAILSQIQNNLLEKKTAHISIKSDQFDINNKNDLSIFFGVESILNSIKKLASKEKVIVLIDQLDALSLTMSSNKKVINIVLEFIEQLKRISNVKIIVSIREYDLKNDPLFETLDYTNILHIQRLDFNYVSNKLKYFIKESTKLNNTLVELLRTPLHLSIFIELYPNDNSCISIKTLQDLYTKFWEQKVQDKSLNKDTRKNLRELLHSIVQKMDEMKKIEVPKLSFEDDYEDEISLLLSKDILKEENNKISFFHQTFYDYVFARNFAQKGMSLYEYIFTTAQDLNIREQIKQIIQFIRGTDEVKYLQELESILYSDAIRFHIKLLLISYLGSIESPTQNEFSFIQKLFRDKPDYPKYFIESWISEGWLEHFHNNNFFEAECCKEYSLYYRLITFINKKPNLVLNILDTDSCMQDVKNESIVQCLVKLDKWNKESINLFKKNKSLFNKDSARYHLKEVYKKIYSFDQDFAIEFFFNFLDNRIEQVDKSSIEEILNYEWYEIFEFLLEQNNVSILQKLLKTIQTISYKFKYDQPSGDYLFKDQVFNSTMWQFQENQNSTWDLYLNTLKKMSQLALDDKNNFLKVLELYEDSNYLSLITFLIFGYSEDPQKYKYPILKLLKNIKLLEEISFDQDDGYELALLLNKSFVFFDETEQEQILNSIVQVDPNWQKNTFLNKWSNKSVFLGTYRGLQKYKLFYQLEIADIEKFGYLKEFQELQRKFPWYKLEKPHKSRASFVEAPLTNDVYSRISLNNWLQSIKVFNGSKIRSSSINFLRGDIRQHSSQLEKEVKTNPDKFFDFLLQLKSENIHPDYLSAGLSGLVASNYNEEKVLRIIHLYSDIDNIKLKMIILKAIEYLISKNKFDVTLLYILEANKNIKYEGLVRDENKNPTISDHINSSINSFEGNFAGLLPLIYKNVYANEKATKRVLNLINGIIEKNINFVIFGLLRTVGEIEIVDKKLFKKILLDLVYKDEIGQIAIYSLQNFHYLYMNKFISKEEVINYIRKCISFAKLVGDKGDSNYIQNLGMYLYFQYLNENDNSFEYLLNDAISSNTHIIRGILHQIFDKEIHSSDNKKVNQSKSYILRFKDNEENGWYYQHCLPKLNTLNLVHNDFDFVKSLAQSKNVKKNKDGFIKYLHNEYHRDTNVSNEIFILLEILMENEFSNTDYSSYYTNGAVELLLSLNKKLESDSQKKPLLDMVDSLLLRDTLRPGIKSLV